MLAFANGCAMSNLRMRNVVNVISKNGSSRLTRQPPETLQVAFSKHSSHLALQPVRLRDFTAFCLLGNFHPWFCKPVRTTQFSPMAFQRSRRMQTEGAPWPLAAFPCKPCPVKPLGYVPQSPQLKKPNSKGIQIFGIEQGTPSLENVLVESKKLHEAQVVSGIPHEEHPGVLLGCVVGLLVLRV